MRIKYTPQAVLPAKKVFVCGGGHQGLSMAAHLALNGLEVTLWNRLVRLPQNTLHTILKLESIVFSLDRQLSRSK